MSPDTNPKKRKAVSRAQRQLQALIDRGARPRRIERARRRLERRTEVTS